MKIFIFLLSLLLLPVFCNAKVDSLYIEKSKYKMALKVFVGKSFVSASKTDKVLGTETYKPNNPVNVGLGILIYNTFIDFGYGYGFDFMRNKKQGKTKSFDFQLHNYGRKFIFDIFVQSYKGFYSDESKIELFPDLVIKQLGWHGQYVFNNKQFSYKAAFDQSENQIKSAGSFLVGFGMYFTKIESDSSFNYNGKNTFTNFQFGPSTGYAYTWVLNKHWIINVSGSFGINFGSEKINQFGKQKLEVYPTFFARTAFGYSQETWMLGVSYVGNILAPAISKENNITMHSGSFKLSFLKRFNSIFGIKK